VIGLEPIVDPAATVNASRGRGRRFIRVLARVAAAVLATALLAPLLVIASLRWIDPPTSAFMIQRAFQRRFAEVAASGSRERIDHRWTDLDAIAPAMALAVVAAEDQLFPHHHGFDVESIRDAVEEGRLRRHQDASGGRGAHHARSERERRPRMRGASTITQQVAKNLFLWPGRSLLRKGIEAYLAAAIELLWPKRRILEVYLNIAETGRDLYGVGAAAAVYFGKEPASLTRREAALIAAALPDPRRRRPDRPGPWLSQRGAWIETQIDQLGGGAHLAGVLE
jgi:monofunctional biosynthetic peptidoglycan transglycosylase